MDVLEALKELVLASQERCSVFFDFDAKAERGGCGEPATMAIGVCRTPMCDACAAKVTNGVPRKELKHADAVRVLSSGSCLLRVGAERRFRTE